MHLSWLVAAIGPDFYFCELDREEFIFFHASAMDLFSV